MATPPRPISLRVEDYPEADAATQPVLEKLFGVLNPFLSALSGVMANGVSLDQNMNAGLLKLKFRTKPTVSDTFPFRQKLPFTGTCVALCPAGIRNLSSPSVLVSRGIFAQWEQAGADSVNITNITGLDPDVDYEAVFVAFAG